MTVVGLFQPWSIIVFDVGIVGGRTFYLTKDTFHQVICQANRCNETSPDTQAPTRQPCSGIHFAEKLCTISSHFGGMKKNALSRQGKSAHFGKNVNSIRDGYEGVLQRSASRAAGFQRS